MMNQSQSFTRTLKPILAVAFLFGISTASQAAILAVDLTISNTGTINGPLPVTFDYYKINTSGTGTIDPFLRIQANNTEQGYNTSAKKLPFDDKAGNFTRDLSFSSLTASSDGSYKFLLDIGEPVGNNQSLLSLDGLKLYRTSAPGQNSTSVDANGDAIGIVGTLLWNLDAFADNYILLDSNRDGNPGNGFSDMLMSVPASVFSGGVGSTDYLVLWSRFGLQAGARSGASSDGTFEEWAQITTGVLPCNPATQQCNPDVTVPEPTSLLLMSAGLIGFGIARRRKST